MWRTVVLFLLACSLALNVYLLLQKNVQTIENRIIAKVSADPIIKAHSSSIQLSKKSNNKHNSHAQTDNPLVEKIKAAIDESEFISAGFLAYSLTVLDDTTNINKSVKNAQLDEVKAYWLSATKYLVAKAVYSKAEDSIEAYLQVQHDDLDFLYLQVEVYVQQQLITQAIRHAYDVQYHVFDDINKNKVILYARNLVYEQTESLIIKESWVELTELVEEVMLLDPDYDNLYWLFAIAQYELGELEVALQAIEPLLLEPNYKVKAEALLAKINAMQKQPDSIPMVRQGEHFIVDAVINNDVGVSLMLDTGASISLLSVPAFDALTEYSEASYVRDIVMNTAGGEIIASLYQVKEVAIQGHVVNDFIFAVSTFVSDRNDGLLGMNFLKEFDFHIDQKNSALILKDK